MTLNLKNDFHIHANYNDHSASDLTIPNIIKKANELGLEKYAITEHVRKDSNWIPDYLYEIKSQKNPKLVPGFEAKILPDGTINCPTKYMEENLIIASFHNLFGDKQKWLSALEKAIENPFVDVIGHLGPEKTFSLQEKELEKISCMINKHEKIIEINSKYQWPLVSWLKIFKKNGVKFQLGSDAHRLNEIGNFDSIKEHIDFVVN